MPICPDGIQWPPANGAPGQNVTPDCPALPGSINCPQVWKANLPGDGCPDPPAPEPVKQPVCQVPGLPVPEALKAHCLPGQPLPLPPDCQVWMLQCVPGQVPTFPGGGPGWRLQSDPEPVGNDGGVLGGVLAGNPADTPQAGAEVAGGFGGGGFSF